MKAALWIDGRRGEMDELGWLAMVNYGHFTAMQVRRGRVRGLDAHLRRVDAAHRELFGHGLDRERVLGLWAHAVDDRSDVSLRATFYDDADGETHVAVVIRDPADPSDEPQRLRSVPYIRPFAHLKHVGTFAQILHGEQAEQAGYHDALLVDGDGRIAETTMANVGLLSGERIVWPTGPMLLGIGRQLLTVAAGDAGIATETAPVTLGELGGFDAAFTINSVGLSPVEQIDAHRFPDSGRRVDPVVELHAGLQWDRLSR